MDIKKIIRVVCSLPISIYVNFKVLPFWQAKKLPLIVDWNTTVKGLKRDCIQIDCEASFAMVKFGIQEGTDGVPNTVKKQNLIFSDDAVMIIRGKTQFGRGISVRVGAKGILDIGAGFTCNKGCFIACSNSIKIGNDFLMGWNSCIRDMDGHNIWVGEKSIENLKPSTVPIEIGDRVWIGAHADILKGTVIPNGCIVAYRSCVFKKFSDENCIIGGYPARIIQHNILWE